MALGTIRLSRFTTWAREHPTIVDAAFALALIAIFAGAMRFGDHPEIMAGSGPMQLLAAATALTVVTGRRRWPLQLLVFDTAMVAVFIIATGQRHPLVYGVWMIVAYTYAKQTPRRRAWLVGGAFAAFLLLIGGLFSDAAWFAPENLGTTAWGVAAAPTSPKSRNAPAAQRRPARTRPAAGSPRSGCASRENCTTSSPTTSR